MANQLKPTVRAYMHSDDTDKRFVRLNEMASVLELDVDDVKALAVAAGSLYKLSRIELIHKGRFDEFMKHIYKVPGTNKQVQKKFVRIGEGSIIYSIGHHRFIEMARAAGATYKINEGNGIHENEEYLLKKIEQYENDLAASKEEYEKPFMHEEELAEKLARQFELNAQLDLENEKVADADLGGLEEEKSMNVAETQVSYETSNDKKR